jgi:uncharacterized Tic20 family protein
MNSINNKPSENASTPYNKEEKNWAMYCHLSGLLGVLVPFGNIIAPLIIWQLKRDELPFVNDQGKEALNFQISITIYLFVSLILLLVVVGFFLLIAIGLFSTIFTIIAAINAADGIKYRYPLTLRLIQ